MQDLRHSGVEKSVPGLPFSVTIFCSVGSLKNNLNYCQLVQCLLCHYCIFSVNCVIYVCLQYFDTVGWVLQPVKNRRPYNLYCVGGDVKPCSINQSVSAVTIRQQIIKATMYPIHFVKWYMAP